MVPVWYPNDLLEKYKHVFLCKELLKWKNNDASIGNFISSSGATNISLNLPITKYLLAIEPDNRVTIKKKKKKKELISTRNPMFNLMRAILQVQKL